MARSRSSMIPRFTVASVRSGYGSAHVLSKCFACAVKTRLDCSDGDFEDRGNLLDAHLLTVEQVHHSAVRWRQSSNGLREIDPRLGRRTRLSRTAGPAICVEPPSPHVCPDDVRTLARGDPVDPRRKLRRVAQAAQTADYANPDLLHDVAGRVGGVAGPAEHACRVPQ